MNALISRQKDDYDLFLLRSMDADDKTIEGILELYNLSYGEKSIFNPFIRALAKEKNPTPWIWKNQGFPQNPEKNLISLALYRGKIIGYTSYIQKTAYINGKEEIMMQSNDSMIHPRHRKKGIFQSIVSLINVGAFDISGAKYFYSFPNEMNPRIRHKDAFKTIPINNVPFFHKHLISDPGQDHIILQDIPSALRNNWYEMMEHFSFGITRDPEFISWRYLENPHNRNSYEMIATEGSFAVLKVYNDKEQGVMKGHLVDLVVKDISCFLDLLRASESYFFKKGVRITSTFMFQKNGFEKVLSSQGYEFNPWGTYFVIGNTYKLDNTLENDSSRYLIQMGDNDIF